MNERTKDYAPHPRTRCPACDSPNPESHPAVQLGGEVEVCPDDYHLTPTNKNKAAYIAEVHAKRAWLAKHRPERVKPEWDL